MEKRHGPRKILLLVGPGIPRGFRKQAKEECLADLIVRCGYTRAWKWLRQDGRAVFVLSADQPYEELAYFVDHVEVGWRRGLLVGPKNDKLACEVYRLDAFADYIVTPMEAGRLKMAEEQLGFWYQQGYNSAI